MKTPAALAREREGYATVEDAAKVVNLSPSTIRRYERGDGLSLGVARKLARFYNCSPFLFTRQAIMKNAD